MASYWIVVPRGNEELFELLSVAFRGRTGFSVIEDRRAAVGTAPDDERRGTAPPLGPDEIVIAERADRTARISGVRRSRRVPIAATRQGRSGERPGRRAATAPAPGHRLVTL
jgi:hypothetical protein